VVREVTAYRHSVHSPVAEPLERAAEPFLALERVLPVLADEPYVDVAYDAERKPRTRPAGSRLQPPSPPANIPQPRRPAAPFANSRLFISVIAVSSFRCRYRPTEYLIIASRHQSRLTKVTRGGHPKVA
jgi:hypothetical protein